MNSIGRLCVIIIFAGIGSRPNMSMNESLELDTKRSILEKYNHSNESTIINP